MSQLRLLPRPRVLSKLSIGITLLTSSAWCSSQGLHSAGRDGIYENSACGFLSVRAIADGAIRVRCTEQALEPAPSLVLVHTAGSVAVRTKQDANHVVLTTAKMSANYDRRADTLSFWDSTGKLLLQEKPGRTVRPSTVQGQPTFAIEEHFSSPQGEHLFGSGQFQDGFLNIRDLPRRLTQVNTQIAIPFFVSSRGYGLLWHNYGLTDLNPADRRLDLVAETSGETVSESVTTTGGARTETRTAGTFTGDLIVARAGSYAMMLDVGQAMARRYKVKIDGKIVVDFANRWLPPTTSWFVELASGSHHIQVDGEIKDKPTVFWRASASETVLRSPVSDGIDYVVFAGPQIDNVIATFRQVSGQAPLLPVWAYGFIQSRERYNSSAEILANAEEFRTRKLPLDVIVQDWQYWGKHGWNAMQWDEEKYPDPAGLVRKLHEMHTKLMVSVWSRIDPKSEVGQEFTAKNYYIPKTDWVDFFNPSAAALYWENFSQRMLSLGIDAWWQDATEPENDDLAGRMTAAGPGETMRLVYPLFVNKTVYEGQRAGAPGKRVFILTRSAFPGQQRYASATWSGDIGNDWETLRRQIPAGLNYSVTGMPYWTTDTGGFFRPGKAQYTDTGYQERFLRWLQFSTFTPLQRVHGYQTSTELWHYGKTVEEESKKYLELREQLLPYIYSEAAAVTFSGSTLMRPLVMDFVSDEQALTQKYEYMFGNAFLVAPVLAADVHEWPVYAPNTPGGWYDWWTEERVSGNTTHSLPAPMSRIPLLVRAGSIVPLGSPQQYVQQDRSGDLEIRIYPGRDADFTLYEDEGLNYNYEKGARSTISFHWDDQRRRFLISQRQGTFPGMPLLRKFTIHVAGAQNRTNAVEEYSGKAAVIVFTK